MQWIVVSSVQEYLLTSVVGKYLNWYLAFDTNIYRLAAVSFVSLPRFLVQAIADGEDHCVHVFQAKGRFRTLRLDPMDHHGP